MSGLLILWTLGSIVLNPLFLPSPLKVLDSLVTMIQNGIIIQALWQSFLRITIATLLSAGVSIVIGLLVVCYKSVDEYISPLVGFMRYLPVTAFYPLLIMWVGIDESMKIAFIFCATVFYFLPSVVLAVKEVGIEVIEGALALGFTKFQTLIHVVFTYAMPSICESFLMMYGIGWTYIIIAEVVNTENGLGHIINIASARGRTDMVFASLVVIILASVIFDTLGRKLIKLNFSWKYEEGGV